MKVVCGSEAVQVTGSPMSIVLSQESSIETRLLSSHFSSTKPLCPILTYQIYSDSSLTTIFTDPSITIDTTTSQLSISQSVPQKRDIFVKASSQTAFAYLELNIVICGNEQITSSEDPQYFVLLPGDSLTFSNLETYFGVTN